MKVTGHVASDQIYNSSSAKLTVIFCRNVLGAELTGPVLTAGT